MKDSRSDLRKDSHNLEQILGCIVVFWGLTPAVDEVFLEIPRLACSDTFSVALMFAFELPEELLDMPGAPPSMPLWLLGGALL